MFQCLIIFGGVFFWLCSAKGIASLVGGQIIDNTDWETPELFRAVAVASFSGSVLFIASYYLFIWRRHEKRQMEAR